MNQYNTGMRNASALANRIIQIKGNHYLDGLAGLFLDDSAFIPNIRSWIQLQGFRMIDAESSAEALKRAA